MSREVIDRLNGRYKRRRRKAERTLFARQIPRVVVLLVILIVSFPVGWAAARFFQKTPLDQNEMRVEQSYRANTKRVQELDLDLIRLRGDFLRVLEAHHSLPELSGSALSFASQSLTEAFVEIQRLKQNPEGVSLLEPKVAEIRRRIARLCKMAGGSCGTVYKNAGGEPLRRVVFKSNIDTCR